MQKTDLDNLMRAYYTDYYRTQLGLPDAAGRAEARLHEAENIDRSIGEVERWANHQFGADQKVLIVGGGTGAEFIAFNRRGCETHAVEPNPQAVEIAREQAIYHGYDPATFLQGVGEQLPYADNSFDFVWCFTVLEHVQNVAQCITEMIRVVKPGHRIFLATPDYRQFYEKHYKMMLPLFLPRWMQKCWLAWKRRPTGFIDTLQFVNSPHAHESLSAAAGGGQFCDSPLAARLAAGARPALPAHLLAGPATRHPALSELAPC